MTDFDTLKKRMLENPDVRAEYDALQPEMEIALAVIRARVEAGMTQEQLAVAIGTKQQAISRLERGRSDPKLSTLRSIARATGKAINLKVA